MKKFHSPKSLEETLAEKAETFSLRPSKDLWQGIDSGLQKAALMARIRLYSLLGFLLLLLGSAFYFNVLNLKSGETPLSTTEVNSPQNTYHQQKSILEDLEKGKNSQELPFDNHVVSESFKPKVYTSLPSFQNPEEIQLSEVMEERHVNQLLSDNLNAKSIQNIDLDITLQSRKPVQGNKLKTKQYINPNLRGWSFQVSYVPALSSRNMVSRTPYAEGHISMKDAADGISFGQAFRLLGRYQFGEKLSLSVGLAYMQMGEQLGLAPSTANNQQIGLAQSYGYSLGDLRSIGNQQRSKNQYHYAQIPVTLYLSQPINTRFNVHLGVGLSLGYLFANQSMVFDHRINHYAYNNNFYRSWSFGTHVQTLIGYQVNNRIQLITGPEFHYELLSTFKNFYPVNQHQYNLGWNLGVHIRMGKIPGINKF